jgi:[citrate (pro-3S)-lyase] ligase
LFDFGSRVVQALTKSERCSVASLIESQDLAFEDGADHTAMVEDSEGRLAATASLFGNVIRMVAVSTDNQDAGLSAVAISGLIEAARVEGTSHIFVYTKPDMAGRFASLGFRNIAETRSVSLLEIGEPGVGAYRRYLAENRADGLGNDGKYGSVVINCNPFTLGHRYLIEQSLTQCDMLYVIVVEAELSTFAFHDRLAMLAAGIGDLAENRIRIVGSGEYAVSAVSFPTYFLKDRAVLSVAEQQARVDLDLFLRIFVPALRVSVRFVGSEPLSGVTSVYNDIMFETLPPAGVDVVEVERRRTPSGELISATTVREMLASGNVDGIHDYLPDSSIKYLREKLSFEL